MTHLHAWVRVWLVNVIDYLSKLLMLWNQRILLLNVFQINITFLLELGMLVSLHIRKYLLLFCTYFNHALVFLFSLCNLISYYSWSIVLLGQKLSHSSNILGFSTLHSSICLFITPWLIFPPPFFEQWNTSDFLFGTSIKLPLVSPSGLIS